MSDMLDKNKKLELRAQQRLEETVAEMEQRSQEQLEQSKSEMETRN